MTLLLFDMLMAKHIATRDVPSALYLGYIDWKV